MAMKGPAEGDCTVDEHLKARNKVMNDGGDVAFHLASAMFESDENNQEKNLISA